MKAQVFNWPEFIGGPLHGEKVPEHSPSGMHIVYAEPSNIEKQTFYREVKHIFGRMVAVRFYIYEGDINMRHDEMMLEVIINALASQGIVVKR